MGGEKSATESQIIYQTKQKWYDGGASFRDNLLATCKRNTRKRVQRFGCFSKNKMVKQEKGESFGIPFPLSHSLFKKEMNTMINATAAMSPIIIASVFSTSSSLLLSSPLSMYTHQQYQTIRINLKL
jgi:hypothetical protein